jgi:dihydroneopterin aldolase
MYTVFVQGLEFYGHHGVSAEERTIGHRYIADLRMEVEGDADQTDQIHDTVNYALAAETLVGTCVKSNFLTVERMAGAVAAEILTTYQRVQTVWVRIAKRLPPANMMADAVGVELERKRGE